MPLKVTPISIVTVWPLLSDITAVQLEGFVFVPPLFAVTVNDDALCPGPGESVAQLPPADGSSVVLQVSLLSVYVDAGVSFGVNVAVSPSAVNSTEPATVMLPFVHASAATLHVTVTVSGGFGVGVGLGVGDGEGLGVGR